MKRNKRYQVKPGKIQTLRDITHEIERVRSEIQKTELEINHDYHHILNALTLRNLTTTIVNEIAPSHGLITKAITIGKAFMARKKKKRHDKLKEIPDQPAQ